MTQDTPLPLLNRIAFFRLREADLIAALAEAINAHPEDQQTSDHAAILAWSRLADDVPNGGFTQFFYNHRGDHGVEDLIRLLGEVELPKVAATLREAVVIYHKHQAAFQTDQPWDGLFGGIPEFKKRDSTFSNQVLRGTRALEKWIRAHVGELARDEAGRPIDPRLTGSIEIPQANGLVGEYLEVKNGKPSGAYREFFDDGTVRRVVFYRAGSVSGDYWPDGQLRFKETKRGSHTVHEWFHPNGALQKRFVKDRDGNAVEPVRLYHANGQLAEEVHQVEGKKRGPWLRFFDDGSPRLEAEYAADERLIVHNAWAEDRTQTVKDGTGTFHNDRCSIDVWYKLVLVSDWQNVEEWKDGVLHGRMTTEFLGVLNHVSYFVNGVEEGDSTGYWNNGRVQSVTRMVGGEEVSSQSFPKFDRPVPVVLLRAEANAKLYEAWEHIRVDEYPAALNLAEVQAELPMSDFLREVHERNQSGILRSDYEDCSRFRDSIAYFVTVSDAGEVTDVACNGSGVYSMGSWKLYLPLLRLIRWTPGRIRGRPVECRAIVWVDHTFAEADEAARPTR